MRTKIVGSILMILGTSLGAGMLALPIITAHENYLTSLMLLVLSWLIMTIGAFSLLEVNLWLPPGANLISMAKITLGHWGKGLTWVVYLLLLYSLICAYLSGTSDILQGLLSMLGIALSRGQCTTINLVLFCLIIYRGIGSVDRINRSLMSVKLLAYFVLVVVVSTRLNVHYLVEGDYQWHPGAIMIMLTSFGYAILIPSLRGYLGNKESLLRKVTFFGSLLPLFIYALWILVIQGLIAKQGADGLMAMQSATDPNSLLMRHIGSQLHTPWLSSIANLFISISAITSLLGVSICLTDFVSDGLTMKKQGKSGLLIFAICFLPPWVIVIISPGVFIRALEYAGMLCVILLVLTPVGMLYMGRYRLGIQAKKIVPGGKCALIGTLIMGAFLLLSAVLN